MRKSILILAALLAPFCFSRDASAAHIFGTLVIDFRLQWEAIPAGDGTFSDGTLYSPHMEYWDRANGSSMDIPIEQFTGYLPSFSSPYQNTYTTTNFPLPVADNLPYGGVLSYYKNNENGTEGMIVGLAPDYTPVDDFDTLFNPQDFIVGVSEADALIALKNPVPGTPQTPGSVFTIMVIVQPDIMPRWQYDALSDTYSLSMNLYAFSTPQLAGSSESGATFTPAGTPVPVPAGMTLAAQGVLSMLGLAWVRRRVSRLAAAA